MKVIGLTDVQGIFDVALHIWYTTEICRVVLLSSFRSEYKSLFYVIR